MSLSSAVKRAYNRSLIDKINGCKAGFTRVRGNTCIVPSGKASLDPEVRYFSMKLLPCGEMEEKFPLLFAWSAYHLISM